MKRFNNKIAAITGAGSGIGRAIAQELADHGCQLALSDVNQIGLEDTRLLLVNNYPSLNVKTYSLDVADRQAVLDHAKQVNDDFGSVNYIFNNAGVALSSNLDVVKREDFDWLMNINFWGVVNGTEAFLPYLKQSDDGHIINISSVFGMISLPTQGSYNASKFAVRGYTEALRQEMIANGGTVKVSCVHPGGILTDIAKNSRVADGEDKATLAKDFDRIAQTTPKKAAQTILSGVNKNKARIMIGLDAHIIHFIVRLLGSGYQVLTRKFMTAVKH
ncbi:MAG: NADP-dependent 3-hydroxy acid dehydrogenase YdfG [Bermanella sp.]|jgi:NADP-dependent 3-hydroxy acid dehydrogenase YdfG